MSNTLQTLRDNLINLAGRDLDFAGSLIDQAGRRGLSDKQMFWVDKLAAKATGTAPEPVVAQVGDVSGILALFAKAGQSLKFPKVRLQLDDGRPVVLSIAGERSAHKGTINVTDGGRYGDNVWYGRVGTDGVFSPGNAPTADTLTSVTALLVALAADPAGVGSKYGKLTGACSFCSTALTDGRSLEVGYGPVCAKKWGLPWGAKAAQAGSLI